MIDYQFIEAAAETGEVWERSLLEPLATRALTPFTSSLLSEVTARTWYLYFDRLGFQPAPRQRIVRMVEGRPFANISISARLDAENAGIAPPTLRIDGVDRAIAAWEKPGFLASMKLGRGAKKIEETLAALHRELPDTIAKAAAWHQRVMGLRWSQAEVLQIMEEIERVGAAAMLPFFAARHNLEATYRRLMQLLSGRLPQPQTALVAQALGGIKQGVELEMMRQVRELGKQAAADDSVTRWLRKGKFADWQTSAPAGAFTDALHAFMAEYGHRAVGEGEIAKPRWVEAPQPVLGVVRDLVDAAPTVVTAGVAPNSAPLLAAVDGKARKEAQQLIERMQMLIELQSGGLHAFTYILAGTRRWALAAGREATVDQRMRTVNDVFLYEVEEVKQMMTGEWNVSDLAGIHAAADERRATLATWRRRQPVDLIWGERKAVTTTTVLPASAGELVKPDEQAASVRGNSAGDRMLIAAAPESAAVIYLPVCAAFATADGAVFDLLAAGARAVGRHVVVKCGTDYPKAATALSIDGDEGEMTI